MRVDEIEIPHPCTIDLRERVAKAPEQFHCDHCNRTVHVLSHMSQEAAARVLERRERDNLCVAFLHTPAGEIHFGKDPTLVPASRLRGPRELLRASALALSMAACSPGDGLELFGVTDEGERLAVGGGPPPSQQGEDSQPCEPGVDGKAEPGGEPASLGQVDPSGDAPPADPRVKIESLEPRHTPSPPLEQLLETKVARQQSHVELTVEHCLDLTGRVVDAKLIEGDEEVGEILLETMKWWRYLPYRVDGRAIRVCTEQTVRLSLAVSVERLPS